MPRAVDGWKSCSLCRRLLPANLIYFPEDKRVDGLFSWCRECKRIQNRESTRRHKEARAVRRRAWGIEAVAGYPGLTKKRAADLKSRYGLSPAAFETIWKAQGESCLVCRQPAKDKWAQSVDHCHTTGKVRAILCLSCNTAVGMVYEDADIAARLTEYIRCSRHASGVARA